MAFSLEFQKFFSLEQFFLTVGQNNFGNKIPLLLKIPNNKVIFLIFLKVVSGDLTIGLFNLDTLKFGHNDIIRIEPLKDVDEHLSELSLDSNPLECSCQMRPFQVKSLYISHTVYFFKVHNKFFKKKNIFSYLHFMQLFSADATIFRKKKNFAPKNIKQLPSKVAQNTLDQKFSFQQFFALWNGYSFII